jgi:hypothetical protein
LFLFSEKPPNLFLQSRLFLLSNDSDRLLVHTNPFPTSPQIFDPFPQTFLPASASQILVGCGVRGGGGGGIIGGFLVRLWDPRRLVEIAGIDLW